MHWPPGLYSLYFFKCWPKYSIKILSNSKGMRGTRRETRSSIYLPTWALRLNHMPCKGAGSEGGTSSSHLHSYFHWLELCSHCELATWPLPGKPPPVSGLWIAVSSVKVKGWGRFLQNPTAQNIHNHSHTDWAPLFLGWNFLQTAVPCTERGWGFFPRSRSIKRCMQIALRPSLSATSLLNYRTGALPVLRTFRNSPLWSSKAGIRKPINNHLIPTSRQQPRGWSCKQINWQFTDNANEDRRAMLAGCTWK